MRGCRRQEARALLLFAVRHASDTLAHAEHRSLAQHTIIIKTKNKKNSTNQVRDTVELFSFPRQRKLSLRVLASYLLGITVQAGERVYFVFCCVLCFVLVFLLCCQCSSLLSQYKKNSKTNHHSCLEPQH